jgi:glycosyltransferase involved in cell wall biosynthesis
MPKLDCPVVESVFRPVDEAPVLSIVIPTYNRATELIVAVSSLAEQLTDGLENKVEIIISDNASGAQTVEVIKALAEKFPSVSYLIHARDEGGFFQFFAAPWRARGRWTWVFGSDDALMPGGVAHIVGLLEREEPGFLGLNKRVMNSDLSQLLNAAANSVPDRRFKGFTEMFCALGINQFAFISGNIELTEAARWIDPRFYLTADTRHPHLAALLEKHHASPAYYCSEAYLIHRVENSPMLDYHSGNFFDYGVTLPCVLAEVACKIGAPADLFERVIGDKSAQAYAPPTTTYVDAMLENILRGLAFGKYMTVGQRYRLEEILTSCREHRLGQFAEVWKLHQHLAHLEGVSARAKAELDQARQASHQASRAFAAR